MVVEKFHIYSVKITANTFVSPKIETCSFLLMALSKTPPSVFIIILQADGNWNRIFWIYFFLRRKGGGEDYGVEKITKINNVASFDKFHYLCNLYIFSLCFVLQ